jgi:hypothetical protein
MQSKLPDDYRSPFDKPVTPRQFRIVPFWKHPAVRAAYWMICLGLIGGLLWYIRSMLDAVMK